MSKKVITERPLAESLGLPRTGADSHAHLDSHGLIESLDAVIEQARRAGLRWIGQVFLGPAAYQQHRERFGTYEELFFLMGVHPCDGLECTGSVLAAMREAFQKDTQLRAVGEIGLDFYWKDCPHLVQEEAFRLQLALAKDLKKPVVIHSRDAAQDTLRILEAEGFIAHPVLWHCFSGDAVPELDRIIGNGWHISIPGPVTYPANQELRDAVARIPSDRLLIETDCPYLAPLPWRGKQNEPALVAFTAQTVAEARAMPLEELWTLCGMNTATFFGLMPE